MTQRNVYYGQCWDVDIYAIGTNVPNRLDFPACRQLELRKFQLDKSSSEYLEVKNKYKEMNAYASHISDCNHNLRKYEVLPDSLWVLDKDDKRYLPKPHEQLFRITNGGVVLRERPANILKQFRLGQTTVTPVLIYEFETGQLWSDEVFYFLNLCEWRKFICDVQPDNGIDFSERIAFLRRFPKKGTKLEIAKEALECDVDLWHDPKMPSSIFMSEQLYQALVDADMTGEDESKIRYWRMEACQLSEN